jgi:hypothetical protein
MHIGKRGPWHDGQQQERGCENHQDRPPHSVHLLPRWANPAAVWFSSNTVRLKGWFNSDYQRIKGTFHGRRSIRAAQPSRRTKEEAATGDPHFDFAPSDLVWREELPARAVGVLLLTLALVISRSRRVGPSRCHRTESHQENEYRDDGFT